MRKVFYLFVIFSLCLLPSSILHAQQNKIDSLLSLIKKDKEDTNKVNHLNILAREISDDQQNYDEARTYALQAENLSQSLGYKTGLAISYNNLGITYESQANYSKGLEFYLKSLRQWEELSNQKGASKCFNNIGLIYYYDGNLSQALEYYFKALAINKKISNINSEQNNLVNIGLTYYYQKNYPESLKFLKEALDFSEKHNSSKNVDKILLSVGNTYNKLSNYDSALLYSFKALHLMNNSDINKEDVFSSLGNIYLNQKKINLSIEYFEKAMIYAKRSSSKEAIKDLFYFLSTAYKQNNNYKKAFDLYKNYRVVHDSIFNEENTKKLVKVQMNYEFEKKEAAQKAELDKQAAVAEAEKKKQQIILYSVIGGLLIVLIFAGFIFRALRVVSKQKQMIEEQKRKVEEKQKEILDSIHYAARIQRSILPTEKYIAKSFNRLMNKN